MAAWLRTIVRSTLLGMLGTTDLTNPIDVETLRRSVAMLPASADARIFSREEALRILDVLRRLLQETEFD